MREILPCSREKVSLGLTSEAWIMHQASDIAIHVMYRMNTIKHLSDYIPFVVLSAGAFIDSVDHA